MIPYKEKTFEELIQKYEGFCFSLGKDDEVKNIPNSRDGLIKRLQELNFEWMHEYHIN